MYTFYRIIAQYLKRRVIGKIEVICYDAPNKPNHTVNCCFVNCVQATKKEVTKNNGNNTCQGKVVRNGKPYDRPSNDVKPETRCC